MKIKNDLGIDFLFPSQQNIFLSQTFDDNPSNIFNNIEQKIALLKKNSEAKDKLLAHNTVNNNVYQHKTVIQYVWEKTSSSIHYAIMIADGFLYVAYSYFREFLYKGCFLDLPGKSHNEEPYNQFFKIKFTPIPTHLDYFFFFYIFLTYILIRRIIIYRIFRITSPKQIMKKINELNEIIVSEIITENIGVGKEKSGFNMIAFLSPRSKKRYLADVREIEKYLIEILDEINKIRFPYSKPHIAVVLDELDKIETHTQAIFTKNSENAINNEGINTFTKIPNPSFTIDSTRERQQTLQILLSNLKYFLGDAKAKFIFIAGREMFDASLADISDRNYFMGSIFHDVIYVDSFFTDDTDEKPSDITSMIELYVCQFLIPHNFQAPSALPDQALTFNLQTYNHYILETFPEFNENKQDKVADQIIARQKREKIISIIQQFIIYLTHASNGAPKKVTNYFENFVEFRKLEKEYAENQILLSTFKDVHKRLHPYLVFNYNKQYELSLINYITVPIVLSISNHIKNYGDKILVSATYLFDHLLKFHRNGFSWRNIEYIPEILEINRTPELRVFITNIIHLLSQTHLQTLISGLYNFRFNQRLSNEIAFLSKVSEEASAAFNFTLDESLAIKYYYHSLLFRLEERYKKITAERTEYVHSIALTHSIIGDLYFYDEEYNDAILEYLDSVQYLRYSDFSDENNSLLLILIRNMLKLGLTFEKRKTFDSAYETYKELCHLLIKFRDIDIHSLGLEEKGEGKSTVLTSPDYSMHTDLNLGLKKSKDDRIVSEKYQLFKNFVENFPESNIIDRIRNDIEFAKKENFINKITSQINPNIERILCKISSFEGLRLIYQPLLAKMHIMEKCMIGGITCSDIFRCEKEFDYLQKAIHHQEKYLISVEFFSKLGDILFFKSGKILPKHEIENKDYNIKKGCQQKKFIKDFINKNDTSAQVYNPLSEFNTLDGPTIECAPCLFYTKCLLIFAENFIKNGNITKIRTTKDIYYLIAKKYENIICKDYTTIKILAGLVSDLADVHLSCMGKPEAGVTVKLLQIILSKVLKEKAQNNQNIEVLKIITDISSFSGIIYQYYLSAKLYKKVNESKMYVWQLTKILHLLKDVLQDNEYDKDKTLKVNIANLEQEIWNSTFDDGKKSLLPEAYNRLYEQPFIELLRENLMLKCIRGNWAAYEYSQFAEIPKLKHTFSYSPDITKPLKRTTLSRLSINSDINESVILYSEISIIPDDIIFINDTRGENKSKFYLKGRTIDFFCKNNISPYSNSTNIYDRLLRLNFKVKLNYKIFAAISEQFFFDPFIFQYPFSIEYDYKKNLYLKHLLFGLKMLLHAEIPEDKPTNFPTIPLIVLHPSEKVNKKDKDFLQIPLLNLYIHLIADSIFCLNEIIEVVNAYGKSYILNHSFLAAAHEKMMLWAMIYDTIINISKESINNKALFTEYELTDNEEKQLLKIVDQIKIKIDKLLRKWMDEDSMQSLTMIYHGEMAIRRYNAALETHTQGKAYKNFIENMSFLNDDFNDKIAHFFVGFERFKINKGIIYKKIEKLKRLYKDSSLYNVEEYTTTHFN